MNPFCKAPILKAVTILFGLALFSSCRPQLFAAETATPPACTKADLEIHFGFFESPRNYYNLAVQGQNVSSHACTFDNALFDPRFSGDAPPFKCRDCAIRAREGYQYDPAATTSPVVEPGEIVQRQYRWRMTPEDPSVSCFRPGGMDSEYSFTWTLATPSLMAKVCSDISVVSTEVLARRSESHAQWLWTNEFNGTLSLTALRKAYYIDEVFPLVISDNYAIPPPVGPTRCPPLFIWHRSADGTVRVEERTVSSPQGCGSINVSFRPKRLSNYGDQELQVFEPEQQSADPHRHFNASNILHLQIEDSSDQNLRTWSRQKGLAASVLLDRDTYRVGDDIPLHIAIANFGATDPIYSWDPLWDPCISLGVEVLDQSGKPIPESERFVYPPVYCNGHGFGPRLFKQGRIASLEWSLKEMGWLPKVPGTFTVVLSWCTGTGTIIDKPTGWQAHLTPYATVEATATIHIVSQESKLPPH